MITFLTSLFVLFLSQIYNTPNNLVQDKVKENLLAAKQISLEKRYNNKFVNDVMKDNILLNIAYMEGKIDKKDSINWKEIGKPFKYRFTLAPAKTFAFHDDVSPEHQDSVVVTTKANFNFQDGFKSDGYLAGDGVCHLASLIYWAAKTAGLVSHAPTNHDFAPIPEIAKEYGVSIYKMPGQVSVNAKQNLYITNNRSHPVVFEFDYDGENLKLAIFEPKG